MLLVAFIARRRKLKQRNRGKHINNVIVVLKVNVNLKRTSHLESTISSDNRKYMIVSRETHRQAKNLQATLKCVTMQLLIVLE